MRRAVLLVVLTLCSSRVSLLAAATPVKLATCAPGEASQYVVQTPTVFDLVCPKQHELYPKPTYADDERRVSYVFTDPNATGNGVLLRDHLPGAYEEAGDNFVGIAVLQIPDSVVSLFYQCRPRSRGESQCIIEIKVGPSQRLGPNTCQEEGSKISFSIQAANEGALFHCSYSAELVPRDTAKALDASCSREVPLPAGVALTLPTDEGYGKLMVAKLPKESATLCYACKFKNGSLCSIIIHIAAEENKGGAYPFGVAARSASALGLAIVVVGLLHFC